MKKCLATILIPLLAALHSCQWNPAADAEQDTVADAGLLVTVPSDAIAVACFDTFSEMSRFIPERADILEKPDLSCLKNEKAVLSCCYTGTSSPILTIDLGKSSPEKDQKYSDIISECRKAGLKSIILRKCWQEGTRDAICISPSETLLAAVERHLASGSSILDAPGFGKALQLAGKADRMIFIRNSRAGLLIPADFTGNSFPRKQMTDFIRRISEWTVFRSSDDSYEIIPVQGKSDAYYANMISRLPFSECRIMEILPESTTLAISIATPKRSFRDNYERYLDANVKMTEYRKSLASLKKNSGKDPLKWEEEMNVAEVALVRWDGRSVILVRGRDKVAENGISGNCCRSFISTLYGGIFAGSDDSYRAGYGDWTVYGNSDDLKEFITCRDFVKTECLPGKGCKFIIYRPEGLTYMDKKACTYGISIGKQAS